jgi:hypothetical protein
MDAMKTKNRSRFIIMSLLVLTVALMLSQIVYATDDNTVNLLDIPQHLANALGIPLYAGKLLASLCVTFIFMLPVMIFSRNLFALLFTGLLALGLCIGIGWLEVWYLLIIILIVASLWSGKVRGWLT